MAKKKRPGVRAAPSVRSSGGSVASGLSGVSSHRRGLDRARSTRSGVSTRSGLSGKSTHTAGDARSVRSGHWDDDEKSKGAPSMRDLMKKAGSVGSGLGLSSASGHKISHKQRKARPGLAIAPQGMSTRSGLSQRREKMTRGLSGRSGMSTGSTHRSRSPNAGSMNHSGHGDARSMASGSGHNNRPMKKQMSVRSLGNKSAHSAHSAKSGVRQKSSRSLNRSAHSTRSGGMNRSQAPSPPDEELYDEFDEDNYDEYGEYIGDDDDDEGDDEYDEDMEFDEEEEAIAMPQTEEEIRRGLHTEQVTKGFFRKKVRSIKWYSADIDKVDAGNFEGQETIKEGNADEESSSGEYETDSDDDSEEENVIPDPWYIALGRGLLLLEKKGEETTPIKRWLRFLTWLTFICDATAALVALVQFSGDSVAQCCGRDILNMGGINVQWSVIMRYATIFYLILILLEVYPVLRRGFPFNIVNPIIGFCISFALFFDDSYVEALIMWCIETCAVLSEFAVYRVKIRQVNMRAAEIKTLMPKTTKKKESFEDEDEYLKDLHKARRRYYVLKQEQRMDQRLLQYLHVAVYMNIVMSSIVLMLILVIARNGGLCIVGFDYPNPFTSNQIGRCDLCTSGPDIPCQICLPEDDIHQCYFPYS